MLGISLFAVLPTWAQQSPPPAPSISSVAASEPEISLDELIRLALANNPQLPIARENLEAARQRLGAARALSNPVLEITPGFTGNEAARNEEIILSQPLDLFGRRGARRGVANAQVRLAESQSTLAERSLVVTVKNAAADLFAAQEAESLGEVQVEIAQLFRDAAARRAQLGDVPPVQVQRAELELLRTQNELSAAQAERLARRAGLNQLIGQAPETPLRVALPISTDLTALLRLRPTPFRPNLGAVPSTGGSGNIPATPSVDIAPPVASDVAPVAPQTSMIGNSSQVGSDLVASDSITSDSITSDLVASDLVASDLVGLRAQLLPGALQRPDIVGAQATLEARQAQIRVLKAERLPNVELQARRNSVFSGSGSVALRAVIVVPLFDYGSNKHERRALQAEVRGQEATIALLRSQAATQVEQALIRLQQQRLTVERFRSGIVPQTLDLLRKTQIGYAQGASSYLEVLDAQRTLRAVQTEYLQALVGTRTSEAQLESALGATPPANLISPLVNPQGAAAPPGTAAPGTIPQTVFPPNVVAPLDPTGAPPTNSTSTASGSLDTSPASPGTEVMSSASASSSTGSR